MEMTNTTGTVTVLNDDMQDLSLNICQIKAQVNVLGMLAATGDVEALQKGVLETALLDVTDRLAAAEEFLDRMRMEGARTPG